METINVYDLYGRYLISRDGEIFDNRRKKFITPQLDDKGYFRVALAVVGNRQKQKHFRLHRLLAITFIPNPDNKSFINHINGVKHDNSIENLEWCTHKENMQHSARIGLSKFYIGEKAKNVKITNKIALKIYEDRLSMSRKDISIKYGLSKCTIQNIMVGKTWSHVTGVKID